MICEAHTPEESRVEMEVCVSVAIGVATGSAIDVVATLTVNTAGTNTGAGIAARCTYRIDVSIAIGTFDQHRFCLYCMMRPFCMLGVCDIDIIVL